MPDVTSLKCPNCSAPLHIDSNQCEYCGARVQFSPDRTTVVLAGLPCPECRSDNDPNQRFCGGCGAALVQACPSCGETNLPGFKYCGACGLELREARRQVAEKLKAASKRMGLNIAKSNLDEYKKLYDGAAFPDEILILVCVGGGDEVRLLEAGRTMSTGFVTTDRAFIFLERPKRSLFGPSQAAIARRVPYDRVRSLVFDRSAKELVIDFEKAQARIDLRKVDRRVQSVNQAAHNLVLFVRPFLPLRIQRQW